MKKFLLISASFIFLTGCAQNVALLGPTYSIVKTGGIQQALVGQTISYGVKHQTGKNISDHMVDSLEPKSLDCTVISSNELQSIFFDDYENIDCHLK